MGYDPHRLSATKKEAVEFVETFQTMWVSDLVKYEGDLDKLVNFLCVITFSCPLPLVLVMLDI